jgi:hypothetical protein
MPRYPVEAGETEDSMPRRRDRSDDRPAARGKKRPEREDGLDETTAAGDRSDDATDDATDDAPEDLTADLESQAADYLADNDVWMYGANAEDVLAILDRLEDLTPAEARPVAETWLAVPKPDRDKARKAFRKIMETDLELSRHYQMAREAVGTWLAVKAQFPEYVARNDDWPKVAGQAGGAALDACTALILDEKIDEDVYQTFSNPWFEAMDKLQMEADLAKLEGLDQDEDGVVSEEEAAEAELPGENQEFGPNTDTVTDFLNRLWLLTPEQVSRLVTTWRDADRDDLRDAHEHLQAVVDSDPEYREQVRKAQARLGPWLNTTRFEESVGFIGQSGQGESRKMAGPALADAAAALVLGDLLEPEDAETLYWPWFNLVGAPPLPEPGQEAGEDAGQDAGETENE